MEGQFLRGSIDPSDGGGEPSWPDRSPRFRPLPGVGRRPEWRPPRLERSGEASRRPARAARHQSCSTRCHSEPPWTRSPDRPRAASRCPAAGSARSPRRSNGSAVTRPDGFARSDLLRFQVDEIDDLRNHRTDRGRAPPCVEARLSDATDLRQAAAAVVAIGLRCDRHSGHPGKGGRPPGRGRAARPLKDRARGVQAEAADLASALRIRRRDMGGRSRAVGRGLVDDRRNSPTCAASTATRWRR